MGKSTTEIILQFKGICGSNDRSEIMETKDMMQEPSVQIIDKWQRAMNAHDVKSMMGLYTPKSILIPSLSTRVRINQDAIKDHYRDLFELDDRTIVQYQVSTQSADGPKVDAGQFKVIWKDGAFEESKDIRFPIVIKGRRIVTHHMSVEPKDGFNVRSEIQNSDDFVQ